MTITLSPEIERALTEEAARRGTTPEQTVENVLRRQFFLPVGQVGPWGEELRAWVNTSPPTSPELSAEEKEARRQEALARIRSGHYVDRLSSSEEHSARKAEAIALEERLWRK